MAADVAAVTAPGGVTPSDHGAVVLECRKGRASGEDLRDAGGELAPDASAVTAVVGAPPGDNGAVALECRKGRIISEFLGGATWRGRQNRCRFDDGDLLEAIKPKRAKAPILKIITQF